MLLLAVDFFPRPLFLTQLLLQGRGGGGKILIDFVSIITCEFFILFLLSLIYLPFCTKRTLFVSLLPTVIHAVLQEEVFICILTFEIFVSILVRFLWLLCLYPPLWDFYSNIVIHAVLQEEDFICILTFEIFVSPTLFFASMSAIWGLLDQGIFSTGFVSGRLCFVLFSRFGLARFVKQYFLPIITIGLDWIERAGNYKSF